MPGTTPEVCHSICGSIVETAASQSRAFQAAIPSRTRARFALSGDGTSPHPRINGMEHFDLAALEAGLDEVRAAPKDNGHVALIVRRPAVEEREVVDEAELDEREGLVGDNWLTRGSKSTEDGSANPKMQLTLMNVRSASLVAGTPERRQLAGDQLFVDFDLSV